MKTLALVLASAALALPAAAATPTTRLTITTELENGRGVHTYTLTCGPASVRNLPNGALRPLDACRALTLAARIYLPRLSTRLAGCNYLVAPRRATIAGYRNGRRVRTFVDSAAATGGSSRGPRSIRLLLRQADQQLVTALALRTTRRSTGRR